MPPAFYVGGIKPGNIMNQDNNKNKAFLVFLKYLSNIGQSIPLPPKLQPIKNIVTKLQNKPQILERCKHIIENKTYSNPALLTNEVIGICKEYNSPSSLDDIKGEEQALQYLMKEIASSPEKLTTYLFELGLESFKSICESINEQKVLDVIDKLAEVEAAKDMVEFGRSNIDWKKEKLSKAQNNLFELYRKLESRFVLYLTKIEERDNLPDWKFWLYTGPIDFISGKIDTDNKIAKMAIEGIIQAVTLQTIISHELNVDIESTVIQNFNKLTNKILSSNACDLLHAYEKNKQEEYWLQLSNRLKLTLENKTMLIEYLNN